MDRWPDHGATFFLDEAYQIFVSVVRGCAEQAWIIAFGKGRIRIGEDSGKKEAPVHVNENRFIVGYEFGKQRHKKQRKENPQRPVTAAIGLEVFPAAFVDRRYFYPTPLRGCIRRRSCFRFDSCACVHFRPLESRSRCADRSMYRLGRKSGSRRRQSGRKYKAWQRRRDNRG